MLTENAQPAILTVSIAAYRVLGVARHRARVRGRPQPRRVLGQRGRRHDGLCGCRAHRAAARRYMQEAVPVGAGSMAAILGLDADTVTRACEEAAARRGRQPGEHQRRRAGRDCRNDRGGAARRRAGEGARRQAGHSARGQRAVPLRAAEAGGGAARAGAARAARCRTRACRSWPTSTPSRSATRRRRSTRSSGRCRRRCAGSRSSVALRPKASPRMLRWARARC